jgi:hypothetical protein
MQVILSVTVVTGIFYNGSIHDHFSKHTIYRTQGAIIGISEMLNGLST